MQFIKKAQILWNIYKNIGEKSDPQRYKEAERLRDRDGTWKNKKRDSQRHKSGDKDQAERDKLDRVEFCPGEEKQ